MKTITEVFKVYTFAELNEKAQNKAIGDYIEAIIVGVPYENLSVKMRRAVDEAEKMQTPWFVGEYIMEYAKEEILSRLAQDYYYGDGRLYIKKEENNV